MMRSVFKIVVKIGERIPGLIHHPVTYKIADVLVNRIASENGIFEIEGFKMKRGRTTRYMVLTGKYEEGTMDLMKKEIKSGMNVFDLGANIGMFTLLSSKLVGESGHVFSFEPDPYLFNVLKENLILNNVNNVSIYQIAVSNTVGVEKFSMNLEQDGDNRLNSNTMNENYVEVKTTTIDDFCEKNELKINFLEMDIQGSEAKVFQGMKQTLKKSPNIKIITEFYPSAIRDTGSSPEDYLSSLENHGLIIREIRNDKTLQPVNRKKLLTMKDQEYTNLFCLKSY